MKCEFVTTDDFTQSSLYTETINLVGCCNALIPKLFLQGRKIFAGKIRQELSSLSQSLFRAASMHKAGKRHRPLENANVHFKTLCKFLQACYDLHFLREQYYQEISTQLEKVRQALWRYNLD
jgi:hypothetical protein